MKRNVNQWLLVLAAPLAAQADAHAEPDWVAEPEVALVRVLARDFLVDVGLSSPGVLGVARVRYQLEVVDSWRQAPGLAPNAGQLIELYTPGSCLMLLAPDSRYLVAVRADPQAHTFGAECDGALAEPQAADAIAQLNQRRQAKPL